MAERPKFQDRSEGVRLHRAKHLTRVLKGDIQASEPKPTIRSINEQIGFWLSCRVTKSQLRFFIADDLVNYVWGCGCDAMGIGGVAVQWVKCVKHGGDDFEIVSDEDR